jgi:phospholipase, patatin family
MKIISKEPLIVDARKPRKVFKILSIDGGGIKGLYSSTIIEHLESKYNCSISDHFDMLCGTSTGGLIALALSLKIPASTLSNLYIKKGSKIFPNIPIINFIKQVLWGGKYKDKQLRKNLQEIFEDRKIGESNNLLCIPTYSLTDARPWVFKYDHKEGQLDRDNKARYVDVALSTSAAPTYLPLCEIDYYDNKQFVDGGVWANNPTMVGLIEALKYFVGKGKEYDCIQILSISSLSTTGGKPIGLNRHRSLARWRTDLFDVFSTGQSSFTEYFMDSIAEFNDVKVDYVRIPSEKIASGQECLVKIDKTSTKAINFIRGKGNDQGEICKKKPSIDSFFKSKKTYNTQDNGK